MSVPTRASSSPAAFAPWTGKNVRKTPVPPVTRLTEKVAMMSTRKARDRNMARFRRRRTPPPLAGLEAGRGLPRESRTQSSVTMMTATLHAAMNRKTSRRSPENATNPATSGPMSVPARDEVCRRATALPRVATSV